MNIEYTQNSVKGEPGPNVFWIGKTHEYFQLLRDMRFLGLTNGRTLYINNLSYVNLIGFNTYRLKSNLNGDTITRIVENEIQTELDCSFWRDFLHKVLSISFTTSFVYQEFDNQGLVEEANVIMESV